MSMRGGFGLTLNQQLMAGAAIVAAASASPAQAQTRNFDVPEQAAARGIPVFARQAGVQILASGNVVRGRRTNAVRGSYTVGEGLRRLLDGTGLAANGADGTGIITIRAESGSGEADAGRATADVESAERDAIVVTGTRIPGVEVPSPVTTITRQEFEQTGYSTLEEVFETLPQNFSEISPDGRFANEGGSFLGRRNNSRVTAVNLRGLGAESTLTLLNGARIAGGIDGRVVDISAIPLSAIERIDIVTGGRSAIYGTDAVAGVVNIITRRDFKGFESQAYFGFADEGGERLQLSQIGGVDSERGGFVAAYDFSRDWAFDLGDAGLLLMQPIRGRTELSLNAQAPMQRHSGYAAGRYQLNHWLQFRAQGLYTHKRFTDLSLFRFAGASQNSETSSRQSAETYSVSAGLEAELGHSWSLGFSAGTSGSSTTERSDGFIDFGIFTLDLSFRRRSRATLTTASAVAEGHLFEIGGIRARAAFGAEWRAEDLEIVTDELVGLPVSPPLDSDRDVRSVFGELVVPFVEDGGPGFRRLELSVAGRYDDYSDFGGTFNPQAGLIWEPVQGFTLRGAYATAFRAPALAEFGEAPGSRLQLAADPSQGGALVPVLFLNGVAPGLGPEEAETWSIGFDIAPRAAPWLRASVSYFDVTYDGRIELPLIFADRPLALVRADRFPGLIDRSPTREEVAAFVASGLFTNAAGIPFNPAIQNLLDVAPALIVFDSRTANIASEHAQAIDGSIATTFESSAGTLAFGVDAVYTLDHERKVTASSPEFSLVNEVGKPADLRIRGTAGWTRGAFAVFSQINYVDGYRNPFSTPPGRIESWTTIDLTARLDGSELNIPGFLDGLSLSFSINNLLDSDPPRFGNSLRGVLYDTTNASPFGRFISLRLVKRW